MGIQFVHLDKAATKTTTMAATINKSKENIIHFLKKASTDRKSNEYAELVSCLLKMFVDSDINMDGAIEVEEFSGLVDTAAFTPRKYGYAPSDEQMYNTEEAKLEARKKMFEAMDKDGDGSIQFNEFLNYTITHIAKKSTALVAHPNIETNDKDKFMDNIKKAVTPGTPEHKDFYWYCLEIFMENATNDATANVGAFTVMVQQAIEPAKKLGVFTAELTDEKMEKIFKKIASKGVLIAWDEFLNYCVSDLFKISHLNRSILSKFSS